MQLPKKRHHYEKKRINKKRPVYRRGFHRQADPFYFKTCRIARNDIVATDMSSLVRYLTDHIKELSGDYLMVAASREIVMACEDRQFYRCLNSSVFSIPDGAPLATYGRLHGYKNMERITGPDLMLELFKISEEKGLRHYFYGNRQEVLDEIRTRLHEEYPRLQIAGMHPSFYRDLTPEEDKAVVEEINASHPDFVWFCLGSPKGCYFTAEHQGLIEGLLISVGAGFDFYSGRIRRAPMWMQKMNLEWFYRVIQEPKRLIKRYAYTIPRFFLHAYILRR